MKLMHSILMSAACLLIHGAVRAEEVDRTAAALVMRATAAAEWTIFDDPERRPWRTQTLHAGWRDAVSWGASAWSLGLGFNRTERQGAAVVEWAANASKGLSAQWQLEGQVTSAPPNTWRPQQGLTLAAVYTAPSAAAGLPPTWQFGVGGHAERASAGRSTSLDLSTQWWPTARWDLRVVLRRLNDAGGHQATVGSVALGLPLWRSLDLRITAADGREFEGQSRATVRSVNAALAWAASEQHSARLWFTRERRSDIGASKSIGAAWSMSL